MRRSRDRRGGVQTPPPPPAGRGKSRGPAGRGLNGLDIAAVGPDQVEVLLGANVMEAILQREVRVGRPSQPVAIKTHFGWALTGSIAGIVPTAQQHVMHVHRCTSQEDELNELLQDWWRTESFGASHTMNKESSHDDRRAIRMLEETTRLHDGHFECGFLWKNDEVSLPNNRIGALHRLERTEKSLQKNPEKAKAYKEAIDKYVSNGHAGKLGQDEVVNDEAKRWYLPHHAVINQHKPGKIRIVFDASAEFHGTSLNKELLTGPDLLQELPSILMRFREKSVAIAGDIDQMFHQIRIWKDDRPALSFLWRDMECGRPPDTYEMNVAIFGAKCSPATASYALRKAIEGYAEVSLSKQAAADIAKQFYMDDYVASADCPKNAAELLHTVTRLVATGGFNLRKWTSNSREVMESVEPADRAHAEMDAFIPLPVERVLGLVWDTEQDTIGIHLPRKRNLPSTKRGVLKYIMAVYDPLGLLSPFTLRAKLFMQDLWRQQLTWDSHFDDQDLHRWRCWQEETDLLAQLRVPRCYDAPDGEVKRRELHVFSDASEAAFGAAGYLRQIHTAGAVSCALVMSRTRVAPLKQLTVVRLELQGAVLATRLAESITAALSLPIDDVYYWTDSRVVLGYINNEVRRFHTFVANRVAEIRDKSDHKQWRHVPGSLNPADDCSRGLCASALTPDSRWFRGPSFLRDSETEWPRPETPQEEENDPEVKVVAAVSVRQEKVVPLVDPARFSSWTRYTRVLAWVLRFARNFAAKRRQQHRHWSANGPLSTDELCFAEAHILRECQQAGFPEETDAVSHGRPVPTKSALRELTPLLDEDGILRVGGRLTKSDLPTAAKHPIILPRHHDVTRLIIMFYHRQAIHAGVEHTMNELRQRFWLPKARSTLKSLLHSCAVCKGRRVQPQIPLLAELPRSRFDCKHAFSSVGLDFCGPIYVRTRRGSQKRYILLVTCLASRAVHLEVTSSLDTDCFLLALPRFIARRGRPTQIFSDNGKNLKRGEKELREALQQWNKAHINDALAQHNIKWYFNPPAAPHMGGCWESLISSVKRALRVTTGRRLVSEEVLQTVLTEVEHMLNSRPITYVSSNAGEAAALTPNHILLGRDCPSLPPGVFSSEELCMKRRWRHSQQIADHFWRRWTREYLPTLIRRQKWTKETRGIRVGDVVLVAENTTPRGHWPLARVTKVFPGSDGRVRSVELRTQSGTYVRPVIRLCLLEESV